MRLPTPLKQREGGMKKPKENPAQCSNTATGLDMSNGKPLNIQAPQPLHRVKKYLLVTLTSGVTFKLSSNTRLAIVFNRLVESGEKGISRLDLEIGEHLSDIVFRLKKRGLPINKRTRAVRRFAIYWIAVGTIKSIKQ